MTAQTKRHPLSVCDVVRQADLLDGHVVNVRGTIRSSGGKEPSGPYFDEMVAPCSGTLTATIKIVSPDAHFLANQPPGYRPDQASIRRAESLFTKEQGRGKSVDEVVATVEGFLVKPGAPRSEVSRDESVARPGNIIYLVVASVRRLEITTVRLTAAGI
jgi:hypothetical protein